MLYLMPKADKVLKGGHRQMGYYDPPEYSETEVDFTCKNDECEHENENVIAYF